MMICLMMTAPYLVGGDSNTVREAEMPNAHSVVVKTIKRTYYLTDKAKKNNSQREERLILEGDLQHMPQPTIGVESKRFSSLLPVAVKSFQSSRSQLAYFVRKTIVASGLSKTQARKHVKLMFPSNTAVRREARRTQLEWYETITDKSGKPILDEEGNEQEKLVKETMKEGVARVTLEYTARQIILHSHLSSKVHSQWTPTFDGLEKDYTEKATELGEQITSLGGYTSIYDVEMAAKEEVYEIEKFHKAIDHKNHDILVKFEKWSNEENPLITEACFKALPEIKGKFKIGTERSLVYNIIRTGFNARCNENRDEKEAKVTTVNEMLAQKQSQHNELEVTKLYNEMKEYERLAERFGFYYDSCSSNFNSEEFDAPWMDQQLSMSLVQERFILTQLKNVELDDNVDFALLHHPGLIKPALTPSSVSKMLTPSSVSEMLGAQLLPDANSGFRIPRKEKPVFKGNLDKEGINDIRQLSEKLGLPTRIDNHSGFKAITPADLWEQYHNSSFELKVPTGVLAELGREFNGRFKEGETYRSKWAGQTYQFTTPTLEVQQKQEEQQEFDELFSQYNFG